jgi:hypothetical protein
MRVPFLVSTTIKFQGPFYPADLEETHQLEALVSELRRNIPFRHRTTTSVSLWQRPHRDMSQLCPRRSLVWASLQRTVSREREVSRSPKLNRSSKADSDHRLCTRERILEPESLAKSIVGGRALTAIDLDFRRDDSRRKFVPIPGGEGYSKCQIGPCDGDIRYTDLAVRNPAIAVFAHFERHPIALRCEPPNLREI